MSFRALTSRWWTLPALGLLFVLGLGLTLPLLAPQQDDELSDSPYLRIDPEKILLSERDSRVPCGECHVQEYEVWEETKHATGFDNMHRSEQAQDILDRMDFRLSKRESLCLRCHYTAKVVDEEPRAIAGVSCESCHGAARDWMDLHNDYGQYTHDTEPEAHMEERIRESVENGMLRPSGDLYAVAANCFECHTVPQEELINKGGHPSGSPFELVAWSDSIRHNFLEAQWSDDKTNDKRTPERKRLMYVIGRSLDYEYSIRGLAKADGRGIYAKAMESRIKKANRELRKILQLAAIPEVEEMLAVGAETELAPGNLKALRTVADTISQQAQQFNRDYDGTQLADLDPLIAGEDVSLPAPEPTPTAAQSGTAADPDATPGSDATKASAEPRPELPGQVQSRPPWFPALEHDVTGPLGCNCHVDQQQWWNADAHYVSADPLLNNDRKALQIADLYGLSAAEMKRGSAICMNCHGTALSGEEQSQVYNGVSCESCHGAGGDFKNKHQDSGYDQGAGAGMKRLEQLTVRAQNCARCHHISDERLLAAGHPTGEGFQLAQRNERIRHWEAPIHADGELNAAYASALQPRSIPDVEVVEPREIAATTSEDGQSSNATAGSASSGQGVGAAPQPPSPRPAGGVPRTRSVSPFTLPPFPQYDDSTSIEQLLLLSKERLELLHRKVNQ